ncbi:MAG: UvrD-helicase domain-containing protein [Elusimicrobia bacterium]|nr:UvrD-helicase domain-containing protein [Elusimicrobiota bacterium]
MDISRLAALTFTEKAAGEIKVRLAARLNDIVAGRAIGEEFLEEVRRHFDRTPAQVRLAAESALQGLDRAAIGTIHHFASTLLRLYPLQSRVDPLLEVDTGEAFQDFFESEWALWLDDELGVNPPRASQWLEVLAHASLDDLADLSRALCREGTEVNGLSSAMRGSLSRLAEEFARLPEGKPAPGGNSKIMESIAKVSAHLQELVKGVDSLNNTIPKPVLADFRNDKNKKWPKSWAGHPGEAVFREGVAVASSASAHSEAVVRKAVELVRPFAESFRNKYARKGLISFDGLLLRARALVRDHQDVRRELKSRFEAILIDEFQDTDPLQGEILLFLAEEMESHAGRLQDVRFAPGKLFVVGDPKQSIYRFRGADIRAYDRFTRRILEQGGVKCDLQTNFRSPEGILSPINAIFSQIMRKEGGVQPDYLPIYPKPGREETSDPKVHVAIMASSEEAQQAEARWMARWIKENSGRYKFKDVAVLFRTISPLASYLDALKEARIPYVVESDRYFYGTQEVIDFLNLLRVLDDPTDTISLTGLLRSPLVGLDDREIYSLSRAGDLTYFKEPPKEARLSDAGGGSRHRLAAFYGHLRRFRERVGKEPLEDFLSHLLQNSFLLELCSAAYQQEQTASNLLKFRTLASRAGTTRGATLKEFIRTVTQSIDESAEEGESPLADEHLDAVRLLTIHKAKGLEYPVVFLANASGGTRGVRDRRPICRIDWEEGAVGFRLPRAKAADAAFTLLEQVEEKREALEWTRLLYVAMTRAKERLFLMGRADGDRSSFARLLSQAGAWNQPLLPVIKPEEKNIEGTVLPNYLTPRPSEIGAIAELWLRRYRTQKDWEPLVQFRAPSGHSRELPKEDIPVEKDELSSPVSVLIGQACHRVLEGWDFKSRRPPTESVARVCRQLQTRHPLADWDRVVRESDDILRGFLASPAARQLAESEILGREVPFLCSMGGDISRGSIDILFRQSGRLWVADYKTDRLIADASEKYMNQGRAYVNAVNETLHEPCGFQLLFLRTCEKIDLIPSPS